MLTARRPAAPVAAGGEGVQQRATPWVVGAVGAVVVAGVALRFWTTSHLWLDEALTVNIARLPLADIPDALRHDGAPPLFYVLLHGWIEVFGAGDVAVRALAGVFGVAALPLAWVAGRRIGGRPGAVASLLLLASSPFAIRYSTEARMYSLVVLLVLAGGIVLADALARPTAPRLAGVAVLTALLLLTHYWSMYLLAVVGLAVAWQAVRAPEGRRRADARRVAVALAAGGLLFTPWLPVFLYQSAHTGTPWADPASFGALVNAVSEFAGGVTSTGRALGLVFFALVGLGIFGRAVDDRRIELDVQGRPRGRALAYVFVGTLLLAVVAGRVATSAFQARYASVALPAFVLLAALGTLAFADRRIRASAVAVAVALGFAGAARNVTTDRTQAGEVAAAIEASARPGDVVGFCPDQLGPAVSRLLPDGVVQLTYPEGERPERVDWVDYDRSNAAGDPAAFGRLLSDRAGPGGTVWYVWAPGYLTLGTRCEQIGESLKALRTGEDVVVSDSDEFYEFPGLQRYTAR